MEEGSINNIAKDYDMPIWVVEKVIKNHPEKYHEKLEEMLKERTKTQ